ncbi:MAG TPA: DUF4394 domain-containing protein [Pyrinomonadaceae bacterium]|nr:DUF4394 domain-containing protein [Pyrinomonadaceae bacterium]
MNASLPARPAPRPCRTVFALLLSLLFLVCALPLAPLSRAARPAIGSGAIPPADAPAPSGQADATQAREAYGKLPLRFELNRGQTDGRVKFLARGRGYNLFLTQDEAVLALRADADAQATATGLAHASGVASPAVVEDAGASSTGVVRMSLKGANRAPRVEGLDELEGRANYLNGSDAAKWRAGVESYARVAYREVYAGVDMVFYGNQRELEYDFHVAAGARAEQIRLAFKGAQRLEIDARGDLILRLGGGREVRQHRPVLYQEIGGERREVAGSYVIEGQDEVGFQIGAYDARRPLVIDPVLSYATYIGGGSDDVPYDIAVDSTGHAYITGATTSVDFPTANPVHLPAPGKVNECFVLKLNPAGTGIVYSTYIGGSSFDNGQKISVDSSGNAYVMGNTHSPDFPLHNAVQTSRKGTSDVFVLKLNAQGSALVYSTYLGGTSHLDTGTDLAVDAGGSAYVTGYTYNTDFPVTAGAYQTTKNGLYTNIFISKIAPNGSTLAYSTYLGAGGEYGPRIGVDGAGQAVVACESGGSDFPTTAGAFQTTRTNTQSFDVGIAKLNASGSALVYGTYLGGANSENPTGLAVDSNGFAYILGRTYSRSTFPTTSSLAPDAASTTSTFITKLNSTGSAVSYSTQIGVNGNITDIAFDPAGNAYAVGGAGAGAPTTTGAIQTTSAGLSDAYALKLNSTGTALLYATYYGGNGLDFAGGVALDPAGNVYVAGYTESSKLPVVPGSLRTKFGGGYEGFAFKLSDGVPLLYTVGGRVADAGGQGVGGVTITLSGAEGSTQTDADGNYSFSLPAYGSYILTPAKAGYVFDVYSLALDNLNSNQTANFKATATDTSYTIAGRVRGPDFFSIRVDELTIAGTLSGRTLNSIQGGGFSFKNLAAGGTYTITPVLPGYSFTPSSITFNNLSSNKTETDATFVGTKVSSIHGLVANSDNNGLGGIKMTVTKGDGTIHTLSTGELLTNGEGIAALLKLPRGETYRVTPSSPGLTFSPASITFENLSSDPGGKFVIASESATPTPSPTPANIPPPITNAAPSVPVFATTRTNELVLFNSNTPETPISRKQITGIGNGSTVVGLDIRPATGQLYALVQRAFTETLPPLNLFTIDPATAVATLVPGPSFGSFNAFGYGFDFNPVTDRIRVVATNGMNLRVNPDTGEATADTPLAYASGDPNAGRAPSITGAAYTNNFAGATSTTLYDIDSGNPTLTSDILVRQGSVGGSPVSPDSGQLFTVGALNFSTLEYVGFDVAPGTADNAFAAMYFQDGPSQFFSVNLSTGAATRIGNSFADLFDIAIAPQSASGNTVQFNAAQYSVNEDCTARTVTVTRSGLATAPVSVDYFVEDNTAKQKSDYTFAAGKLTFAPGETSKTFQVLISEDAYAESTETATLTLSNPTGGATLGPQATAALEINDDGDTGTAANPINDAANFVCQHYHDFLNREPDASGLAFWTNQIEECTTQGCREVRRINVSAAFFLSIEFQQTGFLVYRFHQAAFNTGEHLQFRDFMTDTQRISRNLIVGQGNWQQQLETNKQEFAEEFAARPAFLALYPLTMSHAAFIDALNANTGNSLSQAERDDLVARLNAGTITRGQALRAVAEDADFRQRERSRAFVLTEYFGYVRRNPDDPPNTDFSGYQFWLNKLNQFGGDHIRAEMVKAFITSSEYRQRFGQN